MRDTAGFANPFFSATFATDVDTAPFPATLAPVEPLGSLAHHASQLGRIHHINDTDSFELSLQTGQLLSVVVAPETGLAPTVSVLDPSSTVLATSSGGAGQRISVSIPPIATGGTYTLQISGDGATTGAYDIDLLIGASHEQESVTAAANDSLATAEDLAGTGADLDPAAKSLALVGGLASNNDVDWYSLPLLAGQPTSLVVKGHTDPNLVLTLHASDGTQLAAAITAANVDQWITDFMVPTDQTVFVRLAGQATGYSLVATAGVSFGIEPSNPAEVQNLDISLGVLGHVGSGVEALDSVVIGTSGGASSSLSTANVSATDFSADDDSADDDQHERGGIGRSWIAGRMACQCRDRATRRQDRGSRRRGDSSAIGNHARPTHRQSPDHQFGS